MKKNFLIGLMFVLLVCGCISKPTGTQSIYLIQHIPSGKFLGKDGLTDDLNKTFSDLDKTKMENIRNSLDKKDEYRVHEIWAVYYDKPKKE